MLHIQDFKYLGLVFRDQTATQAGEKSQAQKNKENSGYSNKGPKYLIILTSDNISTPKNESNIELCRRY
jgi:hypothetical protein